MKLLNLPAPEFTLKDQNGYEHGLKQYQGEFIVLYFYPKDDTPGCTTEACSFRDELNNLKEHHVQVLGVSADTIESHKKFADKFKLNFPLLADMDKKVVNAYGVWVEKSMYGKKYIVIQRDSFLIDKNGIIIKHYEKVKPEKHTADVLADIQNLLKRFTVSFSEKVYSELF